MNHEELALLRAIVERFDDDMPRLVYADWLEEHDRWPRAEFIRLQCHLHQALTNPAHREHFSRLIDNLQDFQSEHDEADYLLPQPECFFGFWGNYYRGFPERLEVDCRSRDGYTETAFDELWSLVVPIHSYVIEVDDLILFQMLMAENLLEMCQAVEVGPRTCHDQGIFRDLLEHMLNLAWPPSVREVRLAAWPLGTSWLPTLLDGNVHPSFPKLSFPRDDIQTSTLYPELFVRMPQRVELH